MAKKHGEHYMFGILAIVALVAIVGLVMAFMNLQPAAVAVDAVNTGGQASYWDKDWDEDFSFGDGDKVCYGPAGCYGKEKRDCKSPCTWKDGSTHGTCCATEFGSQSMCDMGNTERGCGAVPDCEWEIGIDTCPEGGGGFWAD